VSTGAGPRTVSPQGTDPRVAPESLGRRRPRPVKGSRRRVGPRCLSLLADVRRAGARWTRPPATRRGEEHCSVTDPKGTFRVPRSPQSVSLASSEDAAILDGAQAVRRHSEERRRARDDSHDRSHRRDIPARGELGERSTARDALASAPARALRGIAPDRTCPGTLVTTGETSADGSSAALDRRSRPLLDSAVLTHRRAGSRPGAFHDRRARSRSS
jgi:hypothetical protein